MVGLRPGVSLGTGGHVRCFSELRLFTRVAATLAQRIVTSWARIALLPADSVAHVACLGAAAGTGQTWCGRVDAIASSFGITPLRLARDLSHRGPG